MDLEALIEKHNDEFLNFARVENKRSKRADLHAFMLLDELFPDDGDMVAAAEYDIIYLAPDPEELAKRATEAQVIELIRCGMVIADDSLAMYA